ncbi:MAG: hypothetical protein GY839_12910 [candidate division Zixibacteria bacterium]|nr:hypothetical protein [candidate division Zixibacteria bacterium]
MKECFIIMPITTPEFVRDKYPDLDHFSHVLEHLFIPAIEKAKFKPIKPVAQGSDIIQGEIIRNLETTDLVLCDISILNPNVFFELGVRTALNKPVSLVKDSITNKIPFDVNMIHHHSYRCGLNAWELNEDIEQLSVHIKQCVDRSNEHNALWDYFSLSSKAQPLSEKSSDDKMEFLVSQVEALRNQLGRTPMVINEGHRTLEKERNCYQELIKDAVIKSDYIHDVKFSRNYIKIFIKKDTINYFNIDSIQEHSKRKGIHIELVELGDYHIVFKTYRR